MVMQMTSSRNTNLNIPNPFPNFTNIICKLYSVNELFVELMKLLYCELTSVHFVMQKGWSVTYWLAPFGWVT